MYNKSHIGKNETTTFTPQRLGMNTFTIRDNTDFGLTYIRFLLVNNSNEHYYLVWWQPLHGVIFSFKMITADGSGYFIHPLYHERISAEIIGREKWLNEQIISHHSNAQL
jgi:hypothetical protein